ncbi:MAG TPA: alpha/beta fold hydrolase [Bacteroidetes bacterium]|nr:alpha/beta fold hydrolase [Bacteroidota bacterium]
MKLNFDYISSQENLIQLSLYGSGLSSSAPCIVYLHGFKGFKDWGFAPWLGENMAKSGIRLLAMNFSHNGIGDHLLEFTEEDKFRDNTFSLEVSEAREIIQKYSQGKLFGAAPETKIGVIGHSRGGGIALLSAWDMPEVSAICTWAAVSTFFRFPETAIAAWKERGIHEVMNSRTGQILELGWNLHQDLLDHGQDRLNIEKAVRALTKPLCILHGTEDMAVPTADAQAIFDWAENAAREIHFISGAGHTFEARHPFAGSNPHLDLTFHHTLKFFTYHLNS